MGQQQLLLVILVTIIVGIATVVAINIFGQAADQANRDAVRQDLMAAAVQAQAIWARPTLMGGADRSFADFVSENSESELLALLNIPSSSFEEGDTEVENENGIYTIDPDGDDGLSIQGVPSSGGDNITITVERNTETGNWEVTMDGVED